MDDSAASIHLQAVKPAIHRHASLDIDTEMTPANTPGHRRSSTLGSSVTDDWTSQSHLQVFSSSSSAAATNSITTTTASTSAPTIALESGHASLQPPMQASSSAPLASAATAPIRRNRSVNVPPQDRRRPRSGEAPGHRRARTLGARPAPASRLKAEEVYDADGALTMHKTALVSLRDGERHLLLAERLLLAGSSECKTAWAAVNFYHRSALQCCEHLKIWSASYDDAISLDDGYDLLPGYHMPFVFSNTSKKEKRLGAVKKARKLQHRLIARQQQMVDYLQIASNIKTFDTRVQATAIPTEATIGSGNEAEQEEACFDRARAQSFA